MVALGLGVARAFGRPPFAIVVGCPSVASVVLALAVALGVSPIDRASLDAALLCLLGAALVAWCAFFRE